MSKRNLLQICEVPVIPITIPAYPENETCPFLYRDPKRIMTWFRPDELRKCGTPNTVRQAWIQSQLAEIFAVLQKRQIPWVFCDRNGLRCFDRGVAKYLKNNRLIELVTNEDGYITHVRLTDKFFGENRLPN